MIVGRWQSRLTDDAPSPVWVRGPTLTAAASPVCARDVLRPGTMSLEACAPERTVALLPAWVRVTARTGRSLVSGRALPWRSLLCVRDTARLVCLPLAARVLPLLPCGLELGSVMLSRRFVSLPLTSTGSGLSNMCALSAIPATPRTDRDAVFERAVMVLWRCPAKVLPR